MRANRAEILRVAAEDWINQHPDQATNLRQNYSTSGNEYLQEAERVFLDALGRR